MALPVDSARKAHQVLRASFEARRCWRLPLCAALRSARATPEREHLGLAMTSREWVQRLHVRFSEIVRVSGDDYEIVNERGRCDQTVLYRHRFT